MVPLLTCRLANRGAVSWAFALGVTLVSTHIDLLRKASCIVTENTRSAKGPIRQASSSFPIDRQTIPVCTVTSRPEKSEWSSVLNTNISYHLTSTLWTPRTWCGFRRCSLDTQRNSQVPFRHDILVPSIPTIHRVMASFSFCALLQESSNPSNPPVETEDKAFPHLA